MDTDNVGWQNLPKDLLKMIAERSHIRLLRAVCSSWRSSLFLPTNKSPLFSVKIPLPLFLQDAHDQNNGGYFNLTERIIYCVQPPSDQNNLNDGSKSRMGWMLKLEETFSGKMKLFHLISNEEWLNWENMLPPVLNLLDCRVVEVGKEYRLTWTHPQNDLRHKPEGLEAAVLKVVMSSSDNAIMCIFGGRKLGYFKHGDENWYMIDDGLNVTLEYNVTREYSDILYLNLNVTHEYSDIIYHKEKFYVIDLVGIITVIDSSLNFEVIKNNTKLDFEFECERPTLVESNGDLFVVIKRYTWNQFSPSVIGRDYIGRRENMVCLDLFKFSSDEAEMVKVTDLCNQIFCVDYESCISVPKKQLSRSCYPGDYPCSDLGVFRQEEEMNALPEMEDFYKDRYLILWPIPAWLKPAQL